MFPGNPFDLFGSFVITSLAARFAVHQAVGADANIDNCLAKTAVFFAFAGIFGSLTLRAAIAGRTSSGAHENTLASGEA
jgi:hypothetical protein